MNKSQTIKITSKLNDLKDEIQSIRLHLFQGEKDANIVKHLRSAEISLLYASDDVKKEYED